MSYVLDVLLATVFGFALITLATGLFMLMAPDKIHSLAVRLDKTISTEKYFVAFDRAKHIDRYFYKYHHVFGIFIIMGATYTVFMLTSSQGSYQTLPELINPVISSWLYDALVFTLLLLNGLVILIGFIIIFRPSALKAFEAKMNIWRETSDLIKPLDKQRYLEQQRPLKWARLYGLIVLSGSLFILWQTASHFF